MPDDFRPHIFVGNVFSAGGFLLTPVYNGA
jgi:hypothetical protein